MHTLVPYIPRTVTCLPDEAVADEHAMQCNVTQFMLLVCWQFPSTHRCDERKKSTVTVLDLPAARGKPGESSSWLVVTGFQVVASVKYLTCEKPQTVKQSVVKYIQGQGISMQINGKDWMLLTRICT